MRRYKPDMMTVLVILVAIGVIMTTSIQAQESRNNRSFFITKKSASCIDKSIRDLSCISNNDVVLGITDDPSLAINKLLQPHSMFQGDVSHTTSFFALEDNPCKKALKSAQSSSNADISDFKVGLSRYLTVDFEMNDISRLEILSIQVGFKDCW